MANLQWESIDVIPGGHEAWRHSVLNNPDVVLLDSDVFSPPMLEALGAIPLSPNRTEPEMRGENMKNHQQPKEGDK